MTLYVQNIEGYAQYDIDLGTWENRRPGLSAMLRLGNEEEFIGPCVESIIDWFDEIVCCLQCSTDRTEDILRDFGSDKIRIHHYPFKSLPNGPGHNRQPRGSVYERAYFYNWCLAKTKREWVAKWDGDMVAHDWLGPVIKAHMASGDCDVICFAGTNIVHGLRHVSRNKPATANEPRVFRVYPGVYYFTGKMCEDLCHPEFRRGAGFGQGGAAADGSRCVKLDRHGYLHFKHAKAEDAAIKAWPENWMQVPHFQRIYAYAEPGREYAGEIPEPLQHMMGRHAGSKQHCCA